MSVADLLLEGVKLMVLGMGTVFMFLMLLVVAMTGMSRLARILAPEETSVVPAAQTATGSGSREDKELVAVISAAVRHYRARHR
jgi:oxaloacetate decarboxylase gamma subunit